MDTQDHNDLLDALLAINTALLEIAKIVPPETGNLLHAEGMKVLAAVGSMIERRKAKLPMGLLDYAQESGANDR